ncbi:MAG: aminomethyl-transferring glycine dehydrogenase subunit GcvPA [Clostridiaceae bacterium]|nr:aminomethyl-transferring glycine dehydrogenase subunit GcvPA [Clostridiaceae bacterium]
MAGYIPNTPVQQREMLTALGFSDMEDLFADIPEAVRLKRALELPPALSELELDSQMKSLAAANANLDDYYCFLGAGAYDHYIPAAVKNLVSRQEFYTAYTPYQPEISQGTLQAIFEYQTMICLLTGMDVANASLYDGASALAEAVLMAGQVSRKNRILTAGNLHPEHRAVLATYARFHGQTLEPVAYDPASGSLDLHDLAGKLTGDTAAVVLQNPNFFGGVEDVQAAADLAHANHSLLIVSCDPISLGLLKPPGSLGADIVVGEGQALGNSLNFGGPYLGFMAAGQALLRKMPGRIVGETTDTNGRRGFVLTIQTREQHIRREKATSNICTNQALNALTATIYLAMTGPEGLRKAADLSIQKSHYLYRRLLQLPWFQPAFSQPFFKEFAVRFQGDLAGLNRDLLQSRIIGGFEVGTCFPELPDVWLLAVTEKRTRAELDHFVAVIEQTMREKGCEK